MGFRWVNTPPNKWPKIDGLQSLHWDNFNIFNPNEVWSYFETLPDFSKLNSPLTLDFFEDQFPPAGKVTLLNGGDEK